MSKIQKRDHAGRGTENNWEISSENYTLPTHGNSCKTSKTSADAILRAMRRGGRIIPVGRQ